MRFLFLFCGWVMSNRLCAYLLEWRTNQENLLLAWRPPSEWEPFGLCRYASAPPSVKIFRRYGHYSNSILLTFHNPGLVLKSAFAKKTHNQSLLQLFLTVSWDLLAQRNNTPDCLCISVVPEARESRALEGRRVSSKSPSGHKRMVFPWWGVIELPSRQINYP